MLHAAQDRRLARPSHGAGVDPIGLGALVGLAAGCVVGIAAGLTLAPQDIAWPLITTLFGLFGGLCAGAAVGVVIDLRQQNSRLPCRRS